MNAKLPVLFMVMTALHAASAQCVTNTTLLADYFTYNPTNSIVVNGGQTAKILSPRFEGGMIQVSLGTNGASVFNFTSVTQMVLPLVVTGPAIITANAQAYSARVFFTVEIDTPCASFTPSTAVVIPADSGGPVNIILESSVDLITWNAALPGTYGTSTTNRFFRVRAQRTQ